ncbi:phosphonatase-like hydrolase [Arenibacter nanhaiticus]|uniref:Phosphonatase-like hydrolase n=1 Tax=Arenibacter nanhaiticus TaxID=558155 RepID=A0A1M6CT01_9FLAO|nr:phosphonatase-like hydrolase [Arenibacter nanhaiticus]SHI63914.1 phosphonatase-like hydrolase [Arenibacter nanhaiticus]
MHTIELAVFDMAGTTVDEDNVVYKTLQKAINKKGLDLSLDFVLEHGAGKEKHQAIKDILKANDTADEGYTTSEIFEDFKELLKQAYQALEVSTYDGVPELLESLKKANIKVALNTGYDKNTAQLLLDKMGWSQGNQYDALITADDVKLGRPNPDMIEAAMNLLQVTDAQKVLKAGDSIIDIQEGKNAHCGMTVGVTSGAHNKEQLLSAKPTYVLDSLGELKDILLKEA